MAISEESKTKKIYDTKDLSINAEYRRQFQIYKNENKHLFCKLCDKQLKTKHGFKDHYTKRHDTRTIQCHDCNKILRFGQWFSHQQTHQKIICPHCEENIPLLMKSKHVPTCTENPQRIEPIKYLCDQCDFKTLTKQSIERHKQTHKKYEQTHRKQFQIYKNENKDLFCKLCNKQFKTKHGFKEAILAFVGAIYNTEVNLSFSRSRTEF